MREFFHGRRSVAAGLGAMALGAIALATTVPASAGTRAPAQAPGPIAVPGNPTCGNLASPGTTWTELKVDPVADGPYSDGTLSVTIDVIENEATGPTFNWTSNIGVDAVFVKGGPNGNLYLYSPESTGATGLHSPTNPSNGKFYGLSHISFCYDVEGGTTTSTVPTATTTAPTTTTTGPTTSTTPTTASPTTTQPPTTGSAPTVPPAAAPPTARHEGLPVTGTHTVPLLVVGGLLLAGGLAMVARARRLHPR